MSPMSNFGCSLVVMTALHLESYSSATPLMCITTAFGELARGQWPKISPASSSSKRGAEEGMSDFMATRYFLGYWQWRTTRHETPIGRFVAITGSYPSYRSQS